ncbi:MAG: ParA family protein [Thermodesulfobacteriota bacterium]|nr:ParA family protein [Thermodesulfobacteriota bacterium]
MPSIISIVNQKGGVGKTTTAVNLSASISAAEKKCLLVDCDPQGNATTSLGINPSDLNPSLYDLILGKSVLDKAIIDTSMPFLKIIGANPDLFGAEVELFDASNKEYLLRNILSNFKHDYEYIFIDCPPSLGFLTLNALTASDFFLVPLQCEYLAMEGLAQLLNTVRLVKKGLNPSLEMLGIMFTMFDSRNNLSRQVVDEVSRNFKESLFKTIIPRNVSLSEATSYGAPCMLYDIRSKGAQSYLALAKELILKGGNKGGKT